MYKYINRGTQIVQKSRRNHKTVNATAQNVAARNVCTHVGALRDEGYGPPDSYACPCNLLVLCALLKCCLGIIRGVPFSSC